MSEEKLEVTKTSLEGVLRIKPPTVFEDFRGSYVETYNEKLYRDSGIDEKFVQDDFSVSSQNVLRGIHGDTVTTKLISCTIGRIYLVIINWDSRSAQFGHWEAFTLSEQNRFQILVPPNHGVGHLVLTPQAVFSYKQSTYYDRKSQFTLIWNDPKLGIWWPVESPVISRRDQGLEGR
jgi:dTDP-4-dehydrorhamnose 3,5-epimerase